MRVTESAAALLMVVGLAQAAPPARASAAPVRPGTGYVADGARCTFAYLLQGSDKRVYAATAGHCLPVATVTTWAADRGPAIQSGGRTVGHARYSVFASTDRDFALIELARGVPFNPSVCHWGGPSAMQTAPRSTPVAARYVGQGELPRAVASARVGAFVSLPESRYVRMAGVADAGDSGAPVLDDAGLAVGVLTSINPDADGVLGVNRLAPHVRDAERALRLRLSLLKGSGASDC